jgi:putative Mg2+ transporter-C (MgtC) family protein
MAALSLPYIAATSPQNLDSIIAAGGFFGTIASIVAGIGFLGAGLIIKTDGHPHGITTAALVWTTSAIGVLVGIGLVNFAVTAAIFLAIILYALRKIDIASKQTGKETGEANS